MSEEKELIDRIKFCYTFEIIIKNSLHILEGLSALGKKFPDYAEGFEKVAESIAQGNAIHKSLSEHLPFVDKRLEQLINLGESTGSLDITFSQLAQMYERELDMRKADLLRTEERIETFFFYKAFSMASFNGIPIEESLTFLETFATFPPKEVIADLKNYIKTKGPSLGNALKAHPNYFSEFDTKMIATGETTGTLDKVLDNLADLKYKEFMLDAKFK